MGQCRVALCPDGSQLCFRMLACSARTPTPRSTECGRGTCRGRGCLRRARIEFRTPSRSWSPDAHTWQSAPTPGPPQVRSGARLGNLPFWIAAMACSRRRASSGMAGLPGYCYGRDKPNAGGPRRPLRHHQRPGEGSPQHTTFCILTRTPMAAHLHVDDVVEAIFQRLCIRQQDGHGDCSMSLDELRWLWGSATR